LLPRYLKFALKSSVSVAKSAQKKHEMIGWTPQIDCHSLLSTIMQNKKLQIVLCHKRIISSKFKISKKNHTPNQLMHLIAIAQVIVDFWFWKQKRQCADNRFHLTIPLFMDVFFEAVFFVRLPYFDWKQCNFHHKNAMNSLEEIWLQFLNTNQKKFSKQHKMLHYLYIYFVSAKNFQRLVLVSVFFLPLIYSYKSWYKNDPKKGEY